MTMPKEQRAVSLNRSFRAEPYPAAATTSTNAPSAAIAAADSTPDYHSPTNERPSTAWSQEDDARLTRYRAQGLNWGPIAANFPSKTANACRKRHERLMDKKHADGWDGIRIEDLAVAYLECREAMWKLVADRVGGEKWTTIERKCMEKGLKTLQSTARAAHRSRNADTPVSPSSRISCTSPPHFNDNTFPDADASTSGPLSASFPARSYASPSRLLGTDIHPRHHSYPPSISSRSSSVSHPYPFSLGNLVFASPTALSHPISHSSFSTAGSYPPQLAGLPHPSSGQTLPSISCAIDMPRLPSILGSNSSNYS